MRSKRIKEMLKAHEVLAEYCYEPRQLERGYTNQTLRIDLSRNEITVQPVSAQMKELWTGGRGFDLWLMFQEINRNSTWDSPENPLCFASGPLGGTASFPGSGKTLVTTISPLTQSIMDCNVGGYFGPFLKFAGFDALTIVGKASDETMVYIDGPHNRITIFKAPLESVDSHLLAEELTEMFAEDEPDMRNIGVVSAGQAADHARMGMLNFSFWDWRRAVARLKQAGRGGPGTVFRNKKLKALVIRGHNPAPTWKIAESAVAKSFTDPLKTALPFAKTMNLENTDDIIEAWQSDPAYVTEMLQDIQDQDHYISKAAINAICKKTGVSRAELYKIATIFQGFSLVPKGEINIAVCIGNACKLRGSGEILTALSEQLHIQDGETTPDGKFSLEGVGCLGYCGAAPAVRIGNYLYGNLEASDVSLIVENHLKRGQPVEKLLYKAEKGGAKGKKGCDGCRAERRHLLRHLGQINPESIDDYLAQGGYATAMSVITGKTPDAVIQDVLDAGLRGRGGGGFLTARKWQAARAAASSQKKTPIIAANAGAFMDRTLLENDPHALIEGLLIGAFAIGARQGFIYTRKEYPIALARLTKALEQARQHGFLGENIKGSGFDFDIHIHRSMGAFVSGESSAVMAAMAGRAAEPAPKYIHQTEAGLSGCPTVLNNIETWANIPLIMANGPAWFQKMETKLFSLSGDIKKPGVYEVPRRTTIREMLKDCGGGVPKKRAAKAVQVGGPSGACLPESMFGTLLDYESLAEAGAMIGSSGIVVMDDHQCMVHVAREYTAMLADESCGKCTPCREGLRAMAATLAKICQGQGTASDLDFLAEVAETVQATSLCQLGSTAVNPVLSTLKHFRAEYDQHVAEKRCSAGVCKSLVTFAISPQTCTGCMLCAKKCPVQAISGERKEVHSIDQAKCSKCGICFDVCTFKAVEVK